MAHPPTGLWVRKFILLKENADFLITVDVSVVVFFHLAEVARSVGSAISGYRLPAILTVKADTTLGIIVLEAVTQQFVHYRFFNRTGAGGIFLAALTLHTGCSVGNSLQPLLWYCPSAYFAV